MKTSYNKAFGVFFTIAAAILGGPYPALADTILYGSTGDLNTNGGGRVYQLDITAQTVTLIGNTGFDRLGGLAFDNNGILFGAAGGSGGPATLMTISLINAAATPIGIVNGLIGVDALRFNSSNALYGGGWTGSSGTLVTIDPTNANLLSSTIESGSGNALTPGLAFNSAGVLYGSRGNSAGHTEDVDRINLTTGQLTPLPLSTAQNTISDIAFGSDGILYGVSSTGAVFSIDQTTGTETLLFNSGVRLSGLANQPLAPVGSVPDSGGTSLLFALALAGLCVIHWKVRTVRAL